MKANKNPHKESKVNKVKESFSNGDNKYLNTKPKKEVKIPSYVWKILAILSCIATMVMYAETMLIPVIPTLIKDFNPSYGLSSWL